MSQSDKAISRIIGFVISVTVLCGLLGADWPEWRGPARDGISKETGLLPQWPTKGPKLLWQQTGLGDGYSTPSIVGDQIFIINNEGLEDEFVQCRSVKDGSRIWRTHIGKVGKPDQMPKYPCARSTPTIDGKMLYALGSDGDLVCTDIAKGEIRWKKNLVADFAGSSGIWAYAESPLVDGDRVVVTPGGKEATLLALNKTNGEVVKKFPVPEGDAAGYASIIIIDAAGARQYVQFLAKGVVGIDTQSGKVLWRYDKTAKKSPANIPTPVFGDDAVYSSTGLVGGGLVKLVSDNGSVKTQDVYFDKKLPNTIGGAIRIGDYLYGSTRELFMCVNFKTGEQKWKKERTMAPSSILFADGKLYAHGETNGDVALIDASTDGYKELGHFTPPGVPEKRVGKAWAYPAVANGLLYIHDWGTLWCYDVKAEGQPRAAARSTTPGRN